TVNLNEMPDSSAKERRLCNTGELAGIVADNKCLILNIVPAGAQKVRTDGFRHASEMMHEVVRMRAEIDHGASHCLLAIEEVLWQPLRIAIATNGAIVRYAYAHVANFAELPGSEYAINGLCVAGIEPG